MAKRTTGHEQDRHSSERTSDTAPQNPKLRLWIVALTLVLVVIVDRITKVIVLEHLRPKGSAPVIDGLFSLTYVENTGVAFGMGQGKSPVIFLILSVICIVIVSAFMVQEFRRGNGLRILALIGWGGVLGGAVGNLWDRIAYGGFVVDFLDVYIGKHHWPAFNVADSAICVGVALMILFLSPAKESAGEKDEKQSNPSPNKTSQSESESSAVAAGSNRDA